MGSIDLPDDLNLEFPNLPPFPSDVPTVPLLRISLARLLAKDSAEDEKLWRACCDLGFFYLDCRGGKIPPQDHTHSDRSGESVEGIDGDALLQSADELFELAESVFDLPVEEKEKYDMMSERSYFGYKGFGSGVIDKAGTRDRNEFWNLSKDDILDTANTGEEGRLRNPAVLMEEGNREMVKSYMFGSHAVVTLILTRLNTRLGLPDGTLQSLHRLQATSGDQVRWVKSPPQEIDDRRAALGAHTDFGSVTVLFNRLGGLQVLPPRELGVGEEWAYVKPLRGHCVVNLGDAMVKFTKGLVRSNMHRVVNPPGEQQNETRYSLVYFNRPEDDVTLKVLEGSELIDAKVREDPTVEEGEAISAKEWILRRALGRRAGGDWEKGQGTDKERIEKRDSGVAAAA